MREETNLYLKGDLCTRRYLRESGEQLLGPIGVRIVLQPPVQLVVPRRGVCHHRRDEVARVCYRSLQPLPYHRPLNLRNNVMTESCLEVCDGLLQRTLFAGPFIANILPDCQRSVLRVFNICRRCRISGDSQFVWGHHSLTKGSFVASCGVLTGNPRPSPLVLCKHA